MTFAAVCVILNSYKTVRSRDKISLCSGRKEWFFLSRLDIKTPSKAQTVVDNLYRDVERRIAASPPGLCPVDMSLTFLQLCHAQSCGKCVPCRIGLGQLSKLIAQVLDGTGTEETVTIIEKTARSILNTADCAIGRDAARLVLDGMEGFRDDYEEHVHHHRFGFADLHRLHP